MVQIGTAQISSNKLTAKDANLIGGQGSGKMADTSAVITVNGQRVANPAANLSPDALATISKEHGPQAVEGYKGNGTGTSPADQTGKDAAASLSSGNAAQNGQLSYQDALKNLNSGGLTGSALTNAQASLGKSYGMNDFSQAHANLQAGGAPAPANSGQALSQVSASLPPTPPDTSAADAAIADHSGIQGLMDNITQLLNPTNQSTTLLQDYQSLYKSSGLDDINKEIINADTIINGTEGDIRNEIQSAGGLGTESQVQAMALSRNKSLLTRYNQLVQMKTDATNQLNTMVGLDGQDKQMAQTKVNNQISAMFQMATFQQQADNNTREAFNNLQKNIGYGGLYDQYKNDPNQMASVEKIMGLGAGGLANAANYEKAHPSLDDQYKLAEIANINSEINSRNNPAPTPQTQAQVVAQGYADRAAQASLTINRLGNQFASPLALGGTTILGIGVPNFLKSSDRQQYEQAQRDFVNAVLRPESGAAISDSEFSSAAKQYFPQAGDSAATVAQKARDRQIKIQNLYAQSNTNQPVSSGDVIQYQGQNYHVDADGNMIPL